MRHRLIENNRADYIAGVKICDQTLWNIPLLEIDLVLTSTSNCCLLGECSTLLTFESVSGE